MLPGSWQGPNLLLQKWCRLISWFFVFMFVMFWLLCILWLTSVGRELNNKLFVCQAMTWVWLLRSLNTWRISRSLPPVCWRYDFSIKVESKSTGATFMAHNYPSPYLCNRMQSWSSTSGEKTLNMHQRVGSSPWTRHQRSTQSNLPRQVRGSCFTSFHNKSIFETTFFFSCWYASDYIDTEYVSLKAVTALCFCRQRQSESGENFIQRAQSAHHRAV